MRRTLMLLRHAKAKRAEEATDDFDRPLSRRGRDASAGVARALLAASPAPDLVLCSAARRTRETWDVIRPLLGGEIPLRYDRELYLAHASRLLDRVRGQADSVARMMVVGHNPGLADLARALAGSGQPDGMKLLHARFPTAALAIISFDAAGWADIGAGRGRLEHCIVPADSARAAPG